MFDSPSFLNFNALACSRLICRSFESHELPSLIEGIFLNKGEDDAINCLKGGDAETFVDIMDQVRYPFAYHRNIWLLQVTEIDNNTFRLPGAG